MAKSSSSSNVKSLSKQLSSLTKTASSVASTAKAQGKDTTGITNAINKSNAMVSQTNRQGGKSFAGSTEEKNYLANVITPASLAPVSAFTTPPPITTTNVPNITALNSALGNPETGLKPDTAGGFTVDAITQNSIANQTKNFLDLYKSRQDNATPDVIGIQKKLDKQTGIDNLKALESDYSGQLNSIVANRDANILKVEGQGRGIPDVIIGGQQSQINKEAAIQALPVQAQLAAVQGKIQVANDYINKWGTLLIQDATNKYNQKNALADAAYGFATDIEKQKLTSLLTQAKEKKDKDIALATAKTKAISQALAQPGGNAVVQAIQSATDENGVVTALGKFNGDVIGNQIKQAQLRELNAPKVVPMTAVQISEVIQKSVSDSNPTTVKSSLATLLGSPLIGASTKARISPSLAVLNSVDELANGNIEGQFTGIGVAGRIKEGIKGLFGYKNAEATTNAQNIEAINLKVQQWASGASLTEQQTKQVNKLTPTLNDRDTTVKTKLNGLYNFMLNQAESDLLTEGVNVQFPAVNLFEISDLYAKASPEQRTLIEQTYFNK